jgi:phytoene synthase
VSRDTSFYYSFLVLPDAQRRAIVTVWDFCRAVDDAVDEIGEGTGPLTPALRSRAASALAMWRGEVRAAFEGGAPGTPQGRALAVEVQAFGLPRRPFEDLIDGVEMDLDHARYASFDELREYCWRVASTVGRMCLPIFGARDPGADDYAVQLGLALQLTNIIRDVGTDLRNGRIYLPQDEMARFEVTEADLARPAVSEPVRRLLAFQGARARQHYARARAALPAADIRRLVAAEIMGAIYFALLEDIEASGYDVLGAPRRLSRRRKAAIAASTWARTMVRAALRRA